jgi:hypothetical protein
MQEVWNDIPNYKGWYQVSNLGNVRSVDRIISQFSRWGKNVPRLMPGRDLTPTGNGNGYLIVSLHSETVKRKNHYVHRLVAESFCDNPLKKPYVNHKDYNTKNNMFSNLEWVTQKENIRYSVEHMRKRRKNGTTSSTGEKYIYARKNGFYRLAITGYKEMSFKSFELALSAKKVILGV